MKKSIVLSIFITLLTTIVFAQQADQVDSLIHHYYQEGKPGIAIAIVKDGKMIHNQALGLANMEHNIPLSDSTAFLIASVSKQFTAYLALKLEREGKLNMSEDVRTYLPELQSLSHKITLYQLANHTHGLPNVSELANVKGFGISDRLWHQDVVDMALKIKTFNFKPGEQYQYNNTGFVLLAEIIERVSEMSFQEALVNNIFQPLGMNNSLAVPSPNMIIKNKAASYTLTNNGYIRFDNNIMSNGSAGIRTTIKDMTKWAKHFQETVKDNNSIFAQMVQPSTLNTGKRLPYGLGLETKNHKGLQAVFHGGGTAGHRAYILHIPEHNFSVIILGNAKDYWPLAIAYKVVDIYLRDQIKEPLVKNKPTTYKSLASYEGVYEYCPGNYISFTVQGDTLYMGMVGSPGNIAITRLSDNTFVYPYYPESKLIFTNNKVNHYIADFLYVWQKTKPVLKKYQPGELKKFTGFYHNEELNTTYQIVIENDQLIARHPINYDIPLQGLAGNSFFSTSSYFGKVDFDINDKSAAKAFKLSGQNLKGLVFKKISR